MGRVCVIKYCKSPGKDKLALFKVPKDVEVHKKWCDFVESEGFKGNFSREKEFYVCELHFLPKYLKQHDNNVIKYTLTTNSFPSVKLYYEVFIKFI